MTFAITTDGNAVNLDTIESLAGFRDAHGRQCCRGVRKKGGYLVEFLCEVEDMVALTAPVVAANPGFDLMTAWSIDGGEDDGEIYVESLPIVAWRLTDIHPEPICVDYPEGAFETAIRTPSGTVISQLDQIWENTEAWRKNLPERLLQHKEIKKMLLKGA